eukprot:scaffold3330_cov398-Pinguiococcus_pyrenoidosus.AAC.10
MDLDFIQQFDGLLVADHAGRIVALGWLSGTGHGPLSKAAGPCCAKEVLEDGGGCEPGKEDVSSLLELIGLGAHVLQSLLQTLVATRRDVAEQRQELVPYSVSQVAAVRVMIRLILAPLEAGLLHELNQLLLPHPEKRPYEREAVRAACIALVGGVASRQRRPVSHAVHVGEMHASQDLQQQSLHLIVLVVRSGNKDLTIRRLLLHFLGNAEEMLPPPPAASRLHSSLAGGVLVQLQRVAVDRVCADHMAWHRFALADALHEGLLLG